MLMSARDVRFWVNSGHQRATIQCLLLTQSGHRRLSFGMNGPEVTEASGISESFELAVHNLYLVSIEFPDNEPIEPLIVGATVISQEPKGLLLADEEAPDASNIALGRDAAGVHYRSDSGGAQSAFLGLTSE